MAMSLTVFLPVLAASIAIPQPGNAFSSAIFAIRDGDGAAVVRLFVAPDRKVEDCEIVATDFSDSDSDRICGSLLNKRAAKSAVGPNGQPVYGTLLYIVADNSEDPVPLRPNIPADFVVDVDSVPGTTRVLRVNVMTDDMGEVSSCEAPDAGAGTLAKIACDELKEQALGIRRSKDGAAVAYVQEVAVEFVPAAL